MELLEGTTLRERLEEGHFQSARPSSTAYKSRAGWPPRTSAALSTGT
jgi:hypothetical protein